MTSHFLNGNHINLRAVTRDDLPAYARWLDNAEVTHYLEMGARPTRDSDLETFWHIANEQNDAVVFIIEAGDTKEAVGICGFYLIEAIPRRAQFNILIGEPSVWDRGYGSEATRLLLEYGFLKLNLNSIQLGVNADNLRAIKSYEKCGFVHEGVRRQFVFRNGRYYDIVMMSILHEEYRNLGC
jgi:RimJ/RimL family protein N-acetyltransferase